MSKYTLTAQLTADEKCRLEKSLRKVLWTETLCADTRDSAYVFPKLVLFQDGRATLVARSEDWMVANQQIYIGTVYDGGVPIKTRLAVILALCNYTDRPATLEKAMQDAIMRYLLKEFQELRENQLIEAETEHTGMAMNGDKNLFAFLLGGTWMLPNGEEVDVTGEEWTVCATGIPVPEAVLATGTDEAVAPLDVEF